MAVLPAHADVYDDIAAATHGSVTRLPRPAAGDVVVPKIPYRSAREDLAPPPPQVPIKHHAPAVLEKTKRTVVMTGSVGPHAGWSYNLYSFQKMAQQLSAEDVPVLLELFTLDNVSIFSLELALASQCQSGLDGVAKAVSDGNFRQYNRATVDYDVAEHIAEKIAGFDRCDQATKLRAQQMAQTWRDSRHAALRAR